MALLLLLLFIPSAFTATFDSRMELGLRYDNIDHGQQEDRLQERVRIYAESKLSEQWQAKTYLATGQKYISAWSTAYDFNQSEVGDQDFNFRHLYGEYHPNQKAFFQLGIIPPVKEFSYTNLKSDGWVEGGSFNYTFKKNTFDLSAGSLNDVDNPRPLSRPKVLNYVNGKVKYHLVDNLLVYTGLSSLDEDQYLQWEFKYFPLSENQQVLDFSLESLTNLNNSHSNFSVAANTYPLIFVEEELKDYLNLQIAYFNIQQDVGTLGTLSDDFYRYGSSRYYEGSGIFTAKSGFSWQVKYWDNDEPRFNFGIHYKLALTP